MKWNHLPVAGGIYDQDPVLMDHWRIIFRELGIAQDEEQKKREREANKRSGSSGPVRRPRRR